MPARKKAKKPKSPLGQFLILYQEPSSIYMNTCCGKVFPTEALAKKEANRHAADGDFSGSKVFISKITGEGSTTQDITWK